MNSTPATPFEKYLTWRLQHIELGKAFNENIAKSAINNLWLQMGGSEAQLLELSDDPEIIPESEQRARALRMDDREAKAELEKMRLDARQQMASAKSRVQESALKDSRILELERRLAELETGMPASPPMRVVADGSTPEPAREGVPDVTWSRQEIYTWADAKGYRLPHNPQFASKSVALNHILAQIPAKELVEA